MKTSPLTVICIPTGTHISKVPPYVTYKTKDAAAKNPCRLRATPYEVGTGIGAFRDGATSRYDVYMLVPVKVAYTWNLPETNEYGEVAP